MYNDFMKADLCNELVEIYNVKPYMIIDADTHELLFERK